MLYIVAYWAMKYGKAGPSSLKDCEVCVVTEDTLPDFMRMVNNSNLYYALVAC